MVDAVGTTAYNYHGSGNLQSEDGPWASDTVTYGYNNARLRNALTLQQPAGAWNQTYGYDSARRMNSLSSGAGSFAYAYLGAGRLVTQIDLPNTSKIVNTYQTQPLAQWMSTELKNNANVVLNKHSYLYQAAVRRNRQTFTDGTFVNYAYDLDDQLTSADASVGNDYSYTYDAGWNMATRNSTPYGVNDLNQVTSEGGGTINYWYDFKGNRTSRSTSSGSLTYVYDAENQLATVHTDSYYTPEPSRWKTEFVYDGKQRLRVRKEYVGYSGSWLLSSETRYIMTACASSRSATARTRPPTRAGWT